MDLKRTYILLLLVCSLDVCLSLLGLQFCFFDDFTPVVSVHYLKWITEVSQTLLLNLSSSPFIYVSFASCILRVLLDTYIFITVLSFQWTDPFIIKYPLSLVTFFVLKSIFSYINRVYSSSPIVVYIFLHPVLFNVFASLNLKYVFYKLHIVRLSLPTSAFLGNGLFNKFIFNVIDTVGFMVFIFCFLFFMSFLLLLFCCFLLH